MRRILMGSGVLLLAGCSQLNWQETYNNAARDECRETVNADARRACLDRVEENARHKREGARSQDETIS